MGELLMVCPTCGLGHVLVRGPVPRSDERCDRCHTAFDRNQLAHEEWLRLGRADDVMVFECDCPGGGRFTFTYVEGVSGLPPDGKVICPTACQVWVETDPPYPEREWTTDEAGNRTKRLTGRMLPPKGYHAPATHNLADLLGARTRSVYFVSKTEGVIGTAIPLGFNPQLVRPMVSGSV